MVLVSAQAHFVEGIDSLAFGVKGLVRVAPWSLLVYTLSTSSSSTNAPCNAESRLRLSAPAEACTILADQLDTIGTPYRSMRH